MKYSLYFIYLVFASSLAVLLAGVFAFINILRLQETILTAVNEKINLAETLEAILYSPLWQTRTIASPGTEALFLSKMGESQDVVFIKLIHIGGVVKRSTVAGEEGRIIEDPDIAQAIITKNNIVRDEIYNDQKIKLIVHPAPLADSTIWIGLSLDRIYKKIEKEAFQGFGIGFAALLSVFLILFLMFRSIIVPVKKITAICQRIRGGNLNIKAPPSSVTEIGELAGTFNEMMANVRESRDFLMKARQKTEEEKDKTLAIINNFSDGLLVFNDRNKLALMNPQAEIFLKSRAENASGLLMADLGKLPGIKPLVSMLEKESGEVFRKELPIDTGLILEVSTITMESGGKRLGTLAVLHDVTREKEVERLKTEFVSLAAHQLRTPLSAIKWALKMMLEGDAGRMTKGQLDLAAKTYQSNERMIDLINDLLNVTRIEEGKYLFKPVLTEIEPIIQSVVNSYKEQLAKKKLNLEFFKPDKPLPKAMLDVEKIGLAVQNLLDNAVRYTPSGGKIIIAVLAKGKDIEVRVQDTGVGIPPNQKERVFTKFFRASNILKIDTEGSGLGLFITKNIIEAHGGKVWFESEENKGTTFYFSVPIKPGSRR